MLRKPTNNKWKQNKRNVNMINIQANMSSLYLRGANGCAKML